MTELKARDTGAQRLRCRRERSVCEFEYLRNWNNKQQILGQRTASFTDVAFQTAVNVSPEKVCWESICGTGISNNPYSAPEKMLVAKQTRFSLLIPGTGRIVTGLEYEN